MDTKERQILDQRRKKILMFMREESYKPLMFDELKQVLVVPDEDVEAFKSLLDELEAEGLVFKTKKKRYDIPDRMNLVTGRVQGNERGYAFIIPDKEDMKDIFVSASALNGAMHNDRVVARIKSKANSGRSSEGEIIKILERANSRVVGTFERNGYYGIVFPDDRRISQNILVAKDCFNNAKTGQKVVAQIDMWPENGKNAEGRVIEVIGDAGEPGTDILSIIKTYGLNESFPEDVIAEAEKISDSVTEDMIAGRRDFRNLKMVTIDGEDAKDLDDAVSIEKLENGVYRLGVHIADVSFYVREGSPLDREALKRGTSVYLVDRVIPMLPKKLSNGICSLNPNVDRMAFSVIMDIDSKGHITDHEICESVININERMTYTNVYKILVDKDESLMKRYHYLLDEFNMMRELAEILYKKRISRGAIDFDFDETKIILDEKGKPVDVIRYQLTIANKIIEEFMLACNETVAEHFYWANIPFVYRIHEDPDKEKIDAFCQMVKSLGYSVKGINQIHPGAFQKLLSDIKGKDEEKIVSTAMLRSFQKARYSNLHERHFGLAAEYYSHFTSPIRRYPDLIIHRIMKEYLKNGLSPERMEELNYKLEEIAAMCSERERAAEDAERECEELKKVEYMKEREGEEFEGIISNVTNFGMFVELENTIEGLVRFNSMEDDYYQFIPEQYMIKGERTGKVYKIGDKVRVVLARADIPSRQIDFLLIGASEDENGENGLDIEKISKKNSKAQRKYKKKKMKKINKIRVKASKKRKKSTL
ncbi:MAG TPA: ribonuclease R [Clostridiaceae bacterium]|nr:ribonuclease R [Clostridiaceae bacterium]